MLPNFAYGLGFRFAAVIACRWSLFGIRVLSAVVLFTCCAHAGPELEKLKKEFPAFGGNDPVRETFLVTEALKKYQWWVSTITDENKQSVLIRIKQQADGDLARWEKMRPAPNSRASNEQYAAESLIIYLNVKLIPYWSKIWAADNPQK